MRILWVKMGGLWPATTGGRVRSLNLATAAGIALYEALRQLHQW